MMRWNATTTYQSRSVLRGPSLWTFGLVSFIREQLYLPKPTVPKVVQIDPPGADFNMQVVNVSEKIGVHEM